MLSLIALLAVIFSFCFAGVAQADTTPTGPVSIWGHVLGSQNSFSGPTETSLAGATSLTAGTGFILALQPDGSVLGIGDSSDGDLGNPLAYETSTPQLVGGLPAVTSISAGCFVSLATDATGQVWTWGRLGTGIRPGSAGGDPTQTSIEPGITNAVAVASGCDHALALNSSGQVISWGTNSFGSLGRTGIENFDTAGPGAVSGLPTIKAISASQDQSLALDTTGRVWAWGLDNVGQLGDGQSPDFDPYVQTPPVSTPQLVPDLTDVVAIQASNGWALALKADGTVWQWGWNPYAGLGPWATPQQVTGLTGIVSIAATPTMYYGLALDSQGTVRAWGLNNYGQLGSNTGTNSNTPVIVPLSGPAQLITGTYYDGAAAATAISDTTPPTVTAVLSPQPNAAGWNNGPVTVSWTATDPDSTSTTPAPITVSTEGANQSVTSDPSCDPSNNCATGTTSVSIDETAPIITGTIVNADGSPRAPGAGGWYNSAVRVHWTCTDALSGVATCPPDSYLPNDGTGLSATATATDMAGNSATATVSGINIDATAPVSTLSTTCGSTTFCAGSTVTVNLTATDGGSGVAAIHTQVNGGTETVFSGASGSLPVSLDSASGSKTVTYWAVDNAGNVEGVNTAVVKYDNVAPIITHSISPAPNAAGWNNSDVTIHWTATDDSGGSDIASVSPDVTVSTETFGITKVGTATDNAGNVSTDSVFIKLDKTAPTIAGTVSGAKDSSGAYVGAVTVHFNCADSGSGIVSCASDVVLTQPGTGQSVTGIADDAAGNSSSFVVSGIDIASPPAAVTITTPANSKIKAGDQITGTISSAAGITSVVATYTPNGNGHSPVSVSGTVTVGGTTNGVTSYSYAINPPVSLNGRMTVTITVTDSYGQVTVSSPVSIVVN